MGIVIQLPTGISCTGLEGLLNLAGYVVLFHILYSVDFMRAREKNTNLAISLVVRIGKQFNRRFHTHDASSFKFPFQFQSWLIPESSALVLILRCACFCFMLFDEQNTLIYFCFLFPPRTNAYDPLPVANSAFHGSRIGNKKEKS